MCLVALNDHVFFGKPTGRISERTTMAVVAQVNDDAGRWLRSVVGGWPLGGSVMQAAGSFGAITLPRTQSQEVSVDPSGLVPRSANADERARR